MKIDIEKLLLTDLTEVKLVNSKGQEYVPIDIKHAYWQKSRYRDDTYLCSECGSSFAVGDKLRRYNYCPYCGAKMDKVE